MSKLSRKSHTITRALITIFALGFLPLSHASTNGEADKQSDLPLDVVLVMDSSGSMKHTDPRELRKPAAKLLISLLGNNDRASVVSFSDQGYPVAFLTPVKGKSNEAKLFGAVDKISNKGVYTNLLGAVEGAMRVIRRDPLPDRKSIIVLMTDGKMDLGDNVKNQSKSETLFNDLIPQLKNQNIELHTIAFTGQSDKAYLEQLAQATGGKFNLAQTDKQLHDVYTSIFEQNKQPNMLPFDGEKFSIDKAIKEVTIVGSKDSEGVVLSLQTPKGELIAAGNKPDDIKWFTAQAFDLITIKNPQPGQWKIKSSTGKNKAYIITDLKFQLEVEPQEVAIGEGLMISAWLQDNGNTIDKPSILSTIVMKLLVHTPEGDTHELDMQAQTKEDSSGELSGVYMSHIALPADGHYKIEVVAKSSTFSRVRNSLVTVFDPNAVTKSNTTTTAQAHKDTSPALTSTTSAVEPPISEVVSKPEPHTPPVHKPPVQETQEVHADKEATPEQPTITTPEAHQQPATKSSMPEHHSTEPQSADHATEHSAEEPVAVPPHSENPEKPARDAKIDNHDDASKEGPNVMKALGIFLVINGVFAMLGGVAYLVYSMKKKKASKPNSNAEVIDDNRIEEKRAA